MSHRTTQLLSTDSCQIEPRLHCTIVEIGLATVQNMKVRIYLPIYFKKKILLMTHGVISHLFHIIFPIFVQL